eukprot:Nk52_evm57s270 gene=Nk52_evmTU57s270
MKGMFYRKRLIFCAVLFGIFAIYCGHNPSTTNQSTGPNQWNWERSVKFSYSKWCDIKSVEEIQEIVKHAAEQGMGVKVVGSGHSWNNIANPLEGGLALNLDDLNSLVSVDAPRQLVTVQAGMRLFELNNLLEKHNFSLPNHPSIDEQTVAALLSTATHGTGLASQIISSCVKEVKLVDGKGDKVTVSDADDEIFPAVIVNLGALGIVYEITLKVVPFFHLHEKTQPVLFNSIVENVYEIAKSSLHVKIWYLFHSEWAQVYSANKTMEEVRGGDYYVVHELKMFLFESIQYLGSYLNSMIPQLNALILLADGFPKTERIAKSYEVFKIPHRIPRHSEIEYAVPMSRAKEFMKGVRELPGKVKWNINHIVEIRFVKGGDRGLMSPDFDGDKCHITLLLYNTDKRMERKIFQEFERLALSLNGFPHWAKHFYVNHSFFSMKLGKNLDKFLAIREKLDPEHIFMNQFLEGALGV